MKYLVGCFQAEARKENFPVQFEYGNKRQIIYILLSYPCFKEEVYLEVEDKI